MITGVYGKLYKFSRKNDIRQFIASLIEKLRENPCGEPGQCVMDDWYVYGSGGETLPDDDSLAYPDILRLLTLNDLILAFGRIRFYKAGETIDGADDINTRDDYYASSCYAVMFVVDCHEIEIYVKDEALRETMYQVMRVVQYDELAWTTDGLGERSVFWTG